MSLDSQNKASTEVYTFGVHLTESIRKKNTHDQLYKALEKLGDDWYQPEQGEQRRIQFLQANNTLICRSNKQPVGIEYKKTQFCVSDGDTLKLKVRLPALYREKITEKKSKTRLLGDDEKEAIYTSILERIGVTCDLLVWVNNPAVTVEFKKGGNKVILPLDEVVAVVEVVDSEKFIYAINNGIGRFKTYGCGMVRIQGEC